MPGSSPNSFNEISQRVRAVVGSTDEPIALGWDLLRRARASTGAHLTEKEIFLAGAGFLFDAMIFALDHQETPTQADLDMLSKLHDELKKFHAHFNLKLNK